jgi:PPOX class probable F420-dependent enzyme
MNRYHSAEEVGDLLIRPLIAVLATYRRDATALLSPVWFEWSGGGFNVCIEDDVKARHVRRDPRVSIVVAEDDYPYRGLEVQGHGQLTTAGYTALARRIAVQYLGLSGEAYAAQAPSGLVLRIVPEKLRAWDLSQEFKDYRRR